MNELDDNSVYRTLFFEETDDHLQQLNEHVLQLESHPEDSELLDDIFRSAHTLKGMAATMGYDVMTKLTHKMENIFDLFKKKTIPVTSDHISLVFRCLDRLSLLVENLREEQELQENQITDLLAELDQVENVGVKQEVGLTLTEEQAVAQEEVTNELQHYFLNLEPADQLVVNKAQAEGYNSFIIGIRIDSESMLKGPRAFLVMEKLEREGDILHTEPPTDELEEGNFQSDFYVLYLTKETKKQTIANILSNSEIDEVFVEAFDAQEHMKDVTDIASSGTTLNTVSEVQSSATTNSAPTAMTQSVQSGGVATKAVESVATHTVTHNQSIRVDLNRLDLFLNLVSELVVYRNQLEDASNRSKLNEIKDSLEQVSRLTSELQDLVLKIRMQQVSVVFSRFPRMVRDLANELNKEMELVILGEETELDKTVVSELSEPLVHLLRNSADHGIELPDIREKMGKSRKGTITLAAAQEGNRVVITITDDGKGLDPVIIKESAESKGIDTSNLSDEKIQQLIFHPGFSTAKEVTNISGRGVGMDVVQSKINQLGGTIELRSEVNKGTTFLIKLPLTLSIIQALMVRISSEIFAIPLDIVERVVMVYESDIIKTANQEVYEFQDELIPIIRTDELLQLEPYEEQKKFAIIVNIDQKYYGILSDELIGQQEIVIKKIDSVLQQINKYQGATILGNGSIALILDINAICHEKREQL